MRSMRVVLSIALVILAACSGCASTGATQVQKIPSSSLSKYKVLGVEVLSQVPCSEEAQEQLEGSIVAKLREKKAFEQVYSKSYSLHKKFDAKLVVVITKIDKVSSTARILVGAFAGRGILEASIELIDTKSNELLAQAKVEGMTSAGTAFSGTTPQAVERVAEQIVAFVTEYR